MVSRIRYVYGREVELQDETPSFAITFGSNWQKEWIKYECVCGSNVSKPISNRQLVVRCDECDSAVRRKNNKWYQT